MARPLRIEFPDALYHVTSRGNEQRPIFRDDVDCTMFLTFLGQAVQRFGWSLTAWVLMTNHYHLVIQTPEANLSRGMHWLNGTYAGWFNHRHKRSGHLFQGRFDSFLVERETYLRELLRYVVLNPVRAKMVARPEDYRWSSYRSTAGLEAADIWLDVPTTLGLFDDDPTVAQRQYEEFVFAKIESTDRLWDNVINGIYLGTECWAKPNAQDCRGEATLDRPSAIAARCGPSEDGPDRQGSRSCCRQARRRSHRDARRSSAPAHCVDRMA